MVKSGSLAVLAAASLMAFGGMTAATTVPAEAGWRNGYYGAPGYRNAGPRGYHYNRHRGRNLALGVAGGLLAVGALAAATSSAYASPAYAQPGYGYQPAYGYQPSYGYAQPVYYAPRCHVRHRTVWDPHYGYVSQPVRVCR